MQPEPHPDCRAPHKDSHEYTGPTHACAGKDCRACANRYAREPIPDSELHQDEPVKP